MIENSTIFAWHKRDDLMKLRLLLAVTIMALSSQFSLAQKSVTLLVGSETKTPEQSIIEAGQDSKVQDHLDYLCNRIGPRLTGSEGMLAACEWAKSEFEKMGLEARIEKWGEFPVGFERGPSYGMLVEPKQMKLEFGTNAWTAGTKGRQLGKVYAAPESMKQLEEMREDLNGAYVLAKRRPRFRRRQQTEEANQGEDKPAISAEERQQVSEELLKCGLAGIITSTSDERILTGGNYRITMDTLPTTPRISLLKTQYDEIKAMVDDGKDVQVAFDIRNHFRKGPIPLYNVIADLKGSEIPDEYVVVGGHIDSWDGATGATDNGAGCATTMEAARILTTAGVKPKRSIRFMLWSGEEQGLLGSRAYVEQNMAAVQKSVSAVFVHDGGTNYVAGIRCTASQKEDFEDIFAEAMKLDERTPFEVSVVETMRPRGGSDHVSFIRAGVPGYFWMQRGRATYRTTHHTQYDTYDTVVPEYQKHSSIVIALGAYGTANLDHLISREGVQRN